VAFALFVMGVIASASGSCCSEMSPAAPQVIDRPTKTYVPRGNVSISWSMALVIGDTRPRFRIEVFKMLAK